MIKCRARRWFHCCHGQRPGSCAIPAMAHDPHVSFPSDLVDSKDQGKSACLLIGIWWIHSLYYFVYIIIYLDWLAGCLEPSNQPGNDMTWPAWEQDKQFTEKKNRLESCHKSTLFLKDALAHSLGTTATPQRLGSINLSFRRFMWKTHKSGRIKGNIAIICHHLPSTPESSFSTCWTRYSSNELGVVDSTCRGNPESFCQWLLLGCLNSNPKHLCMPMHGWSNTFWMLLEGSDYSGMCRNSVERHSVTSFCFATIS